MSASHKPPPVHLRSHHSLHRTSRSRQQGCLASMRGLGSQSLITAKTTLSLSRTMVSSRSDWRALVIDFSQPLDKDRGILVHCSGHSACRTGDITPKYCTKLLRQRRLMSEERSLMPSYCHEKSFNRPSQYVLSPASSDLL